MAELTKLQTFYISEAYTLEKHIPYGAIREILNLEMTYP